SAAGPFLWIEGSAVRDIEEESGRVRGVATLPLSTTRHDPHTSVVPGAPQPRTPKPSRPRPVACGAVGYRDRRNPGRHRAHRMTTDAVSADARRISTTRSAFGSQGV